MYCEHCHNYCDDFCPLCRKRAAREVTERDLCLVIEENDLWCSVLDDVLKQENIPHVCKQMVGVASLVGTALGRWRIYTPFKYLEQARQVCAEVMEPVDDLLALDGEDEPEA